MTTIPTFAYIFITLQVGLFVLWMYYLTISIFGLGKPPKIPRREPTKRFLILCPAHNEEAVIGYLVDNLINGMVYPRDLYTVCVIADNCTDNTAAIARNMGATVLENTTPPGGDKGKPFAIKAALDVLGDRLTEYYDAIAVFDADNLVDANYLQRMNNHLMCGERVIQCYLDSKNPTDNHITLGYAASYFFVNRSWQLAKYRLGLPNAIGGTGFCIDTKVIEQIGWTAKSLVEDLEFTMQCIIAGIQVTWCHTTRVYDEKPECFKASCIQRLRWCRGHWDVAFRYGPKLLWRGISKLDFRPLDAILYLAMPLFMLFLPLLWALVFIGFALGQFIFPLFPLWFMVLFVAITVTYVFYICSIDSRVKYSKLRMFLSILFLNLSYIPLSLWGMVTCRNKVWVRTEHTKGVSYVPGLSEEPEKLEDSLEKA